MKSMRVVAVAAVLLTSFLATGTAAAQMVDKKAMSLEAARRIAAAAEAEAVRNKWNVVIAIVDDGGQLLYLQRMDGAQYGSIDVAIQKARGAPEIGPKLRRLGRELDNERAEVSHAFSPCGQKVP